MTGSVDAVIINGILNLCPIKEAVVSEVHRVLRSGGRLLVSGIVLREQPDVEEIGATCGLTLDDWFQGLRGALPERPFLALLSEAGFRDVEVLGRSRNARSTRAEMMVVDVRALKP